MVNRSSTPSLRKSNLKTQLYFSGYTFPSRKFASRRFWKTLFKLPFKLEEFENGGLAFSCGRKTFWKGSFLIVAFLHFSSVLWTGFSMEYLYPVVLKVFQLLVTVLWCDLIDKIIEIPCATLKWYRSNLEQCVVLSTLTCTRRVVSWASSFSPGPVWTTQFEN